jgi:hypothetical protein
LRRAASLDDAFPDAHRVDVLIVSVDERRPLPLPSPCDEDLWRHEFTLDVFRKRRNPWHHVTDIRASRLNARGWHLRLDFSAAVPSGLVIAAIARSVDGHRTGPGGQLGGPAGPGAQLTGLYRPPDGRTPLSRAELVADHGTRATSHGSRSAAVTEGELPELDAPVDERSVNPIGFRRECGNVFGVIARIGDGFGVQRSDGKQVRLPLSGAVTETEIAELRDLRCVRLPPTRPHQPDNLLRIIVNLAAAGVPLVATSLDGWRPLLGTEMATLVTSATQDDLTDSLRREQHSIRLRRHALRRYGSRGRWRDIAGASQVPHLEAPNVSVLLCTRRIEMIPFALQQVANQRGVNIEVILALHGITRSSVDDTYGDLALPPPATTVEVPASVPLGIALNHAAARAGGAYVAKMDDDDWYGPDHLADLVLSHHYSGADLVGTDAEFVYLAELDTTIRLHPDTTEVPSSLSDRGIVSGGSMLMTRGVFETLGGFRPVPAYEDSELCSAVRSAGGVVYRQHGLNYLYRRGHPSQHTWQVPTTWFQDRQERQWPGIYFNELMLP